MDVACLSCISWLSLAGEMVLRPMSHPNIVSPLRQTPDPRCLTRRGSAALHRFLCNRDQAPGVVWSRSMLTTCTARRSRLFIIPILLGPAIFLTGCGGRGARLSDGEAYRLLDGGDRLSVAGPPLAADPKGSPEIGNVPA